MGSLATRAVLPYDDLPSRALAGLPHDVGELVRRRGIRSGYGLTGDAGGSSIRRPRLLPVQWIKDQRGGT
jgi:hypothetical protein